MEFIELLTMLVSIIFLSKIIAKITGTVDILWYIILGLIGTQYVFHIDPIQLENWSMLGVIFIMFYAGWREDLLTFVADIWKNKWVALLGAAAPFLGAFLIFTLLKFSMTEAIVAGFIFTSTAIPYTIGVLRSIGLDKTPAAKAATSSSVADNFLSVLLAVGILPAYALLVMNGGGDVSFSVIWFDLFKQIGLIFAAFGIFGLLGLLILPDARMHMRMNIPNVLQRDGIMARLTYFIVKIRQAPGFYEISKGMANLRIGIPMTLLLIFGLAWLAHHMGLHPAITAYLTGLILHVEMYHEIEISDVTHEETPITHKNLGVFFYFVQEWIGPIFFIHLGAQLVADWSQAGYVIFYGLIAGVVIAFFQFWAAYFAGKKTSGLPEHESILLGLGMLPYDIIAFVVLGIATATGLIQTNSIFIITVIVTILVINIITSVMIYWYKPQYLKAVALYKKENTLS
ncbi:MAG: Kef-type K+ transport system membrane component KefB [Crocinitomicaceae bacterium]|jgi:Kef-type K+ transport system membrane component KefB